jgi:hypothetical protein
MGGGQRHDPGHLSPGKETLYPLNRRLGGTQGRCGPLWKISPSPPPPHGHRDSIPELVAVPTEILWRVCILNMFTAATSSKPFC